MLAKTFQALTVSCARCHDHKFDAISTRDYYALVGFMQSTRYQEAFVDPPQKIGKFIPLLQEIQSKFASLIQHRFVIDAAQLDALARDLTVKERQDMTHPLYPWLTLRNAADFAKSRDDLVAKMKRAIEKDKEHLAKSILFERFDKPIRTPLTNVA